MRSRRGCVSARGDRSSQVPVRPEVPSRCAGTPMGAGHHARVCPTCRVGKDLPRACGRLACCSYVETALTLSVAPRRLLVAWSQVRVLRSPPSSTRSTCAPCAASGNGGLRRCSRLARRLSQAPGFEVCARGQRNSSNARLSKSTFTRGSPSTPNVRRSVFASTSARTAATSR